MDIILNSAASVNFDDPIHEALQINFYGARRIQELANECKHLLALHHVSTSYANTDLPNNSVVPEEILPFAGGKDWRALIAKIAAMEPQVLEREEPNILKHYGFPNTYTLTKNLAERMIRDSRRPDMRISVTRPAVITACHRFPFPGWTDSIAAAGAVVYGLGMGITNRDFCYENVTGTFTPCDYVVNAILVATAHSVALPTP